MRNKEIWNKVFKRPCFGTASCPKEFQEPVPLPIPPYHSTNSWIVKCPYAKACFRRCAEGKGDET